MNSESDGREPIGEEDPTVVADEGLIRRIRTASEDPWVVRSDADATVVVDSQSIEGIHSRENSAVEESSTESDETVLADAATMAFIRGESIDDSRDEEQVPRNESPEDGADDTIAAGGDLLRQSRVGDVPRADVGSVGPTQEEDPDEPAVEADIGDKRHDSDAAFDELRKRYGSTGGGRSQVSVPSWVVVAAWASVLVLVIAIVALIAVA